jgi:hypothetical protein
MKKHETRWKIIREWMALPKDERQTEEQMQGIANAFFLSVMAFAVTYAYFVVYARAQDQYYVPEHAQLHELFHSTWMTPR